MWCVCVMSDVCTRYMRCVLDLVDVYYRRMSVTWPHGWVPGCPVCFFNPDSPPPLSLSLSSQGSSQHWPPLFRSFTGASTRRSSSLSECMTTYLGDGESAVYMEQWEKEGMVSVGLRCLFNYRLCCSSCLQRISGDEILQFPPAKGELSEGEVGESVLITSVCAVQPWAPSLFHGSAAVERRHSSCRPAGHHSGTGHPLTHTYHLLLMWLVIP